VVLEFQRDLAVFNFTAPKLCHLPFLFRRTFQGWQSNPFRIYPQYLPRFFFQRVLFQGTHSFLVSSFPRTLSSAAGEEISGPSRYLRVIPLPHSLIGVVGARVWSELVADSGPLLSTLFFEMDGSRRNDSFKAFLETCRAPRFLSPETRCTVARKWTQALSFFSFLHWKAPDLRACAPLRQAGVLTFRLYTKGVF